MAIVNIKDLNQQVIDYNQIANHAEIYQHQLSALNRVWADACKRIPRYGELLKSGKVPPRFETLEEYVTLVPPLTRSCIQAANCSFTDPPPNIFRKTGGSTQEPIQMSAWKSEFDANRLDPWIGRSFYGISPNDKMFLFWGHAHLLGTGLKGQINGFLRSIKDKINRYQRVSCYNLNHDRLRQVGEILIRSNARFILGYSHALDALARANADRSEIFKQNAFKGVIASAEGLPMADSREVIEKTFGCQLAMEYGSVETGLLAHSSPCGIYKVFWKNYFIECTEVAGKCDSIDVYVTSLYKRCTPLFRYKIGDRILLGDGFRFGNSVLSFQAVLGRSNQMLTIPSGGLLHSEVASHIVRDCSHVSSFQFVCRRESVELCVVPNGNWLPEFESGIYLKAAKIDAGLAKCLKIVVVSNLKKTIAGKLTLVIDETKS